MRWLGWLVVVPFSALGCGNGAPAPTPAAPGEGSGGEAAPEEEEAAPPAPCAILVESGEESRVIGQPPDNATATSFRLEDLAERAQELDQKLVRTQGMVEAVGRGGRWFVLYDALFEGWGFFTVPTTLTVPAGARGCKAVAEGVLFRVVVDENDVETLKREGRPEASLPEEPMDNQITLQGMQLTPPPEG